MEDGTEDALSQAWTRDEANEVSGLRVRGGETGEGGAGLDTPFADEEGEEVSGGNKTKDEGIILSGPNVGIVGGEVNVSPGEIDEGKGKTVGVKSSGEFLV